jgi:cobalt-zinc-cadmium efflux system outer membrane protein
MKFIQKQLLMLLLLFWPVFIFAQQSDSIARLPDLIEEGINSNPDLLASYHNWQADLAKVPQAGALPDPQLSLNLLNMPVNTFDFNQEPMTGKQIALMQMFPFPGKQGLREDIAKSTADISQAKNRELKNQLIKNIKQTYYDVFFIDQSIATVQKNSTVLQDFIHIAESKYTVGKGLQQDVLKAQVELSKLEEKSINLKQKRQAATARLNALLNRPAGTTLGKTVIPEPDSLNLELAYLQIQADKNRPLLRAWDSMLQQSTKKVDLAKKEYLPDFKLGIAYTQRDKLENGMGGIDYLSGLVSVDIPLYFWRKQNKKVEETRYNQDMVQESYRNVQNQVYSELDKTLSEVEKNYRLLELYKSGIIPQATQSLNAAIAGYQTNKIDFLTLLNNQLTLFNFELDYDRFLSDYSKSMAGLEAATGVKLTRE